jgi:lysophospholipase L1-like esterase
VTTVEYALVLAGVAALVTALFVASPDALKHLYDEVFCHLGIGTCVDNGGGGGPSIDPWDSPDPITRATWGNMVVLGDSYSSGEGGNDYGVTGSTPSCHASANAYGPAVAKKLDMTGRLKVVACTGAVLKNLTHPYGDHHQPPQIGAVDDKTSLITMTLGANDLDWSGVLEKCGALHAGSLLASAVAAAATDGEPVAPIVAGELIPSCSTMLSGGVNDRIAKLVPHLEAADKAIEEQAPHARIVVMGYPHPFPSKPTSDVRYDGTLIMADPSDQKWMNSELDKVNEKIEQAAKDNGVEYVDASDALAGHELTTADPWIFPLDRQSWYSLGPAQHDMHPTPDGQAAMAKLAERQIDHP